VLDLLAVAKPIADSASEASGDASVESLLVFVGGVVAAVAAVIAAFVTSRAARTRLEKTLAHEHYLARRSEASQAIEDVARSVARAMASLDEWILSRDEPEMRRESFALLRRNLHQIREETNVVVLRFGAGTSLVKRMSAVMAALSEATPSSGDDFPLSAERNAELKTGRRNLGKANADFIREAIRAMDAY
jgi:hypothetical protein